MKHQLQLLSPGAFQSMAAALAIAEFGTGIQVMGAGKDGGRDLYFDGPLKFVSTEESAAKRRSAAWPRVAPRIGRMSTFTNPGSTW